MVGLRGEAGGLRYDLSGGYSVDGTRFFITSTLNASLGAASPTAFDAGRLAYSQTTANLDVSRDIVLAFAKSFTVAGGVEYRRETFQIGAGAPTAIAAAASWSARTSRAARRWARLPGRRCPPASRRRSAGAA